MISRDLLEDVIDGWADTISREKIVHRDIAERIEESLAMEEVTVITGVRRSGKTFILYGMQRAHGGIYINFEDERLIGFSSEDFDKLADIMKKREEKILYLDEVQEASGWEKFAHRIHRRIKIVVTGSNSALLASDYASALVGRTVTYQVYPLSYGEYLRFRSMKPERETLMDYVTKGGFPRVVLTGRPSLVKEYFERIIFRDIVPRSGIEHPESLRNLAVYLLSNVGKEFSYRSLTTVSGLKHENTVKEYIAILRNAYLLEMISRYSRSIKAQATYGKKVYGADTGFATIGRRLGEDTGRLLENAVYLHLMRKNGIYYARNGKEVDFVVTEGLKPVRLVNVAYMAEDPETLRREISSLRYFAERLGGRPELVTVYPVKPQEGIDTRLAHRYLLEL